MLPAALLGLFSVTTCQDFMMTHTPPPRLQGPHDPEVCLAPLVGLWREAAQVHDVLARGPPPVHAAAMHTLAVLLALADVVSSWFSARRRRCANMVRSAVAAVVARTAAVRCGAADGQGDAWSPQALEQQRKALQSQVHKAAAAVRQGFAGRRAQEIPLAPPRHRGARHSTLVAAVDYCRRPPAFFGPGAGAGGMRVMKDTEAARALARDAISAQEWDLRMGAEAGRHGEARHYYISSAMARAQLLQSMAAGADSRPVGAVAPPSGSVEAGAVEVGGGAGAGVGAGGGGVGASDPYADPDPVPGVQFYGGHGGDDVRAPLVATTSAGAPQAGAQASGSHMGETGGGAGVVRLWGAVG